MKNKHFKIRSVCSYSEQIKTIKETVKNKLSQSVKKKTACSVGEFMNLHKT